MTDTKTMVAKTMVDVEVYANVNRLVYLIPDLDYYDRLTYPDIEEDDPEIIEYYLVSDWLGRQLASHGEVVWDLGNSCLWGRTTCGQAIYLDGVIQEIAEEMNA